MKRIEDEYDSVVIHGEFLHALGADEMRPIHEHGEHHSEQKTERNGFHIHVQRSGT